MVSARALALNTNPGEGRGMLEQSLNFGEDVMRTFQAGFGHLLQHFESPLIGWNRLGPPQLIVVLSETIHDSN